MATEYALNSILNNMPINITQTSTEVKGVYLLYFEAGDTRAKPGARFRANFYIYALTSHNRTI